MHLRNGTPINGGHLQVGGNDFQGTPFATNQSPGHSLEVGDILFMLSRHKWKIILLGLLGLAGAVVMYLLHEAPYETNAKLLVRYVLERSTIDTEIDTADKRSSNRNSIIRDEMEILTSWDLARSVSEQVGVDRLVANKEELEPEMDMGVAAASVVMNNLLVTSGRNSSVISVSYKHKDPGIAVSVLKETINRYFDKHLEIHRPVEASKFVSEQTKLVRERIEEIDDKLNALKKEAGKGAAVGNTALFNRLNLHGPADVNNIESSWWSGLATWASSRQELLQAESERAGQVARLQALENIIARTPNKTAETPVTIAQPSNQELGDYEAMVEKLSQLRERNASLRQKFPPGNSLIQRNESEIRSLESQRRAMASKFPVLMTMTAEEGSKDDQPIDIGAERALLAATEARIKVLREKVVEVQKAEESMPLLLSKIHDLQRLKASEEEKYFYLTSEVEKAKIDGLLDPSKMPNISVIQSASPPIKEVNPKFKGLLLILAGGGFGLGIALALCLEMFLDRRIKRPTEFEKKLYIPLMLTIPMLPRDRRKALPNKSESSKNGNGSGSFSEEKGIGSSSQLLAAGCEERFWPYAAAIRDRLFSYFQINDLQEGPKLVALTGFMDGSGTSTLAKGVAAISAASGENVLLIDMNASWGEPNSIYEAERLLRNELRKSQRRRGVTPEGLKQTDWNNSGPVTPKNLYNLLPLIRESDFGYVIFDMPPLDPTSPTNAMAGFMDIVLLVVDGTKNCREVVKRGFEELLKVNANVSCIYNKAASSTSGEHKEVVAERRRQLMDDLGRRDSAKASKR